MSLPIGTPMPSLEGCTQWLNGHAVASDLYGQPVLIQFWAVSCPVCKINMPTLQQLTKAYSEYGLHLVSVHRPRMQSDMDVRKVQAALDELGLIGPCAIDNNHTVGDLFQTGGVWPCYFLFDDQGRLRSRAAGVLGLKMAASSLKRMLGVEPEMTQERVTA